MKKIMLLVDHVQRDLPAVIPIVKELAKAGNKVSIGFTVSVKRDVTVFRPDIVVLNYMRPNNRLLIRDLVDSGCAVGVFDTEGAPSEPYLEWARRCVRMEEFSLLTFYCFWAAAQKEAFQIAVVEAGVAAPPAMLVVGCERFQLNPISHVGDPLKILVSSHFAVLSPKYQKGSQAELESIKKNGLEGQMSREKVEHMARARIGLKATIRTLLSSLPNVEITVRPHPFEDVSFWEEFSREVALANGRQGRMSIVQDAPIQTALAEHGVLLHLGCTTAVEALLGGNANPIYLAYLGDLKHDYKIAVAVSQPVSSESSLLEYFAVPPGLAALAKERESRISFIDREFSSILQSNLGQWRTAASISHDQRFNINCWRSKIGLIKYYLFRLLSTSVFYALMEKRSGAARILRASREKDKFLLEQLLKSAGDDESEILVKFCGVVEFERK